MSKSRRIQALENQISRLEHILSSLRQISNRYSWARLLIVISGFLLCVLAFIFEGPWLAAGVFVPFFIIFVIVLILHGRVERSIERFRIWADIKQSHIARVELDWEQIPKSPAPAECSIELDLDLAGDFSLLRLIDTTVSTGGAQRLRAWLSCTEPDRGEVLSRQQLVRELVPRPLFRDKLALSGKMAAREDSRWHSDDLLTWLESDDRSSAIFHWLLLSAGLAAINIILFLLDILAGFPPIWQGTLVVYFALFLIKSRDLDKPFREASHLRDALEQLVAVFKQLEEYSYHQTPNLRMLCRSFLDPAGRPSRQLARVNRVVSATGIRGNFVLWLILNLAVPWDFYFAYLTAVRKREIASLLPTWMEAWFEIEALSSLANLAYLNPHYTFPEISDPEIGSEVVFKTKKMGHPLLHDQGKVCNDFAIESVGEIDLFTGSNMSGKSTFLRTVGINLALAFAGGPVDAELFETIPFRLYTCIRISDSVTDGISYFYAEVKCLKALLDELNRDHPLPLFYFIDEIFRGTNNRERLMGSSAYIQALAGKFGVGLIATHDLELIQLADAVPVIRNYHFTDEIKDGKMYFDYTLRRGPSPTTNALKIMEMEGLPVPK